MLIPIVITCRLQDPGTAVAICEKKHLSTRKIKFNKCKHKQQKWVTNGILKSIKTKNKLYKILQQTKTKNFKVFELIQIRLFRFHKIMRQSINKAKRAILNHIWKDFNMI